MTVEDDDEDDNDNDDEDDGEWNDHDDGETQNFLIEKKLMKWTWIRERMTCLDKILPKKLTKNEIDESIM